MIAVSTLRGEKVVLRLRFFGDGRYRDLNVMGILREEWEKGASNGA
ncbi:MAG: hypothetical protein Q7T26_11560 [Dehalococcoidia bacterium]|nr:hypothetical protein [Dehalococcoidia bacterium]